MAITEGKLFIHLNICYKLRLVAHKRHVVEIIRHWMKCMNAKTFRSILKQEFKTEVEKRLIFLECKIITLLLYLVPQVFICKLEVLKLQYSNTVTS